MERPDPVAGAPTYCGLFSPGSLQGVEESNCWSWHSLRKVPAKHHAMGEAAATSHQQAAHLGGQFISERPLSSLSTKWCGSIWCDINEIFIITVYKSLGCL